MTVILEKKLNINLENARRLVDVIYANKGRARLIGGCVRDALLGVPSKDIDIATDLYPHYLSEIFSRENIKTIPTGIDFGTISVLVNGNLFEVTTLRCDIDTDGRHARVEYTDSFAEDAARRDFTINALSYDIYEEKIYDYYGGLNDLEDGVVRFIGDPRARILEDHLRILRFFRFTAFYAQSPEKHGLEACSSLSTKIETLSRERVKVEIDHLLQAPRAPAILQLMQNKKIWPHIFSSKKFNQGYITALYAAAERLDVALKSWAVYAVLFANSGFTPKDMIDRRFSRKEAKWVLGLIEFAIEIEATGQLASAGQWQVVKNKLLAIWIKEREFDQYFLVASTIIGGDMKIADATIDLYKKLDTMEHKPVFPVKASEVVDLGYSGSEIGTSLELLRRAWIESEFTIPAEKLLSMIKK